MASYAREDVVGCKHQQLMCGRLEMVRMSIGRWRPILEFPLCFRVNQVIIFKCEIVIYFYRE